MSASARSPGSRPAALRRRWIRLLVICTCGHVAACSKSGSKIDVRCRRGRPGFYSGRFSLPGNGRCGDVPSPSNTSCRIVAQCLRAVAYLATGSPPPAAPPVVLFFFFPKKDLRRDCRGGTMNAYWRAAVESRSRSLPRLVCCMELSSMCRLRPRRGVKVGAFTSPRCRRSPARRWPPQVRVKSVFADS